MQKAIAFLLFATCLGCSKPDLTCAVIHEPKSGCPQGYVRDKAPRFTERDGSKQYACHSAAIEKPHCIDVLKPGESVDMHIEIRLPDPPTTGSKT